MRYVLTIASAALLALPGAALSQVAWDSPFMMGPGTTSGLGIHLVDFSPGGDLGAMVTWRRSEVPGGLGLRGGLADDVAGDAAVFGGVDFSGTLVGQSEEFPLSMIWATGAGVGVGDYAIMSVPLGIAVGREFVGDGVRFTPYVGPRLNLDAYLGRDDPPGEPDRDDLDLAVSVDVGADIRFTDDMAVRFGATVGDHDALSIGLVFPSVR